MELPTRKAQDSIGLKTQYAIETKKLSYKLPCRADEFSWFWWREKPANSYVLRNVSCEAKPGEIMAIAGPSGAGKTTLLEILAGEIPPSRVSGRVYVNQQPMNAEHFRRISGYVTQDEALFPFLTIEETLMYSARLRLYGGVKEAAARVKELLKELRLEHVANMRIGGESRRGISGGEKRRVSIGVDLVHDPAVLLLDEPTSGLDSASALHLALLLKSMALTQGKTIVLTIHQPGFRILELFDQILLLSNGTILHHGSLDLLEQHLRFTGHSIPRYVNVLEFAIEMTELLVTHVDQEIKAEESEIEQDGEDIKTYTNIVNAGAIRSFYPNPWFREVLILGKRFTKTICRTNQLFPARMIQALLGGIVLGTIFMHAANDPKRNKIQTQVGFFALSLTFLLSSTTEGLPIFLQERRILMRETSRGAYRISSYVMSNTLVFIPFLLSVAILYTTPVYWLVGLKSEINGFLYFTLVVWMVVLMSNSFVACFSALVPNFIMGTSLIAGFIGCFFLFSGYFISKNNIPRYWIFIHYLSLFKYPFECFLINEYGGETGKGRCLEFVEGECLLYGHGFLMKQGLKESTKWSNVGVMLGFIVGYRILCFLILWHRSYTARKLRGFFGR
ncbi:White-brown-complex ABC transporter family [Tripterygium wilfordii]|uniref:White-brown-complex ABC transporter family n=1 Tax=Tripterygium wilfordii TaxID=458696 RepID=A0A7J7DCI6_TRIWF|nr:ABC transporter G family member 10-like [Tripterygium wilfordii]KAF5744062.1 White-brown-complex ABC transporter family [Tripterygium wilfordii]